MEIHKKDEIKNACEKYAIKYGQKSENYTFGLEYFALHLLAEDLDIKDSLSGYLEGEEFNLEEFRTGGKNDGGIDGLLYDQNELSKVIVIQTKYKKGKIDEETLEMARSFFSRVDDWSNLKKRDEFNAKSASLLDESGFNPKKQEIELYFITTQTSSDSIDLQDIQQIETAKYSERNLNVTCFLWSQSEIIKYKRELDKQKKHESIGAVEFNVAKEYGFTFNNGINKSIICAIKGNELVNIYKQPGVGDNLFNSNIRSALKKGRINPQIKSTAQDPEESKNFFYYNNGITATCSNLDFKDEESKSTFIAEDLQIVNGAQTLSSLVQALRKSPNPNLYVLLRVIETGERYKSKNNFANNIIRYQNTQNPVRDSDFFSNDPIQLWISTNLPKAASSDVVAPFWYSYKRGVVPPGATGKQINLEEFGMLRYACLVSAPFTYKTAREIWNNSDNAENYWKAYGSEGLKSDSWGKEELSEAAWMIRCYFYFKNEHKIVLQKQRELKRNNIETPIIEAAYLGVLSRYATALSFYGMRELKKQSKFTSFADLIGSNDYCKKIESKVIDSARQYLAFQYPEWRDKAANARLNLAQDEQTWERGKDAIFSQVIR